MRDLSIRIVEQPSMATILDIEEFKFCHDNLPYRTMMREREIERLYYRNSTYIIAYDLSRIVGTLKVVEKTSPTDRIPLDYSSTDSGTPVLTFENQYPYCEVAGLKVSEQLPSFIRYNAIHELFQTTYSYIVKRKFWTAYATTKKSNIGLYEKFLFHPFASVHYGFEEYTAMARSIYHEVIIGKERSMRLLSDAPCIFRSQEIPSV